MESETMKNKSGTPSHEYIDLCAREVAWYRANGKYPKHRIVKDNAWIEYVAGDWSWNMRHPNHPEHIERDMTRKATK